MRISSADDRTIMTRLANQVKSIASTCEFTTCRTASGLTDRTGTWTCLPGVDRHGPCTILHPHVELRVVPDCLRRLGARTLCVGCEDPEEQPGGEGPHSSSACMLIDKLIRDALSHMNEPESL